jgi:uncharacterized protein YjbI with pentapeptide repeats
MSTDREHNEQQPKQSRWGFCRKTVWDWMALLIVPLTLVVIGLLFTMLQDARQQEIEDQRAQQAQNIENQRAEAERELAEQRAQDEALQAYLNQMSSLLLERDLRNSEVDSEVSTLARARTVTVLQRLDANRNQTVIRFLNEARLPGTAIGLLVGADLQGAHLVATDLGDADLSEANLKGAALTGADLSEANLRGAALTGADLDIATLREANLYLATLREANLTTAYLRDADLRGANLKGADLRGAALGDADLKDADLTGADLRYAHGITHEELEQQAAFLKGATMPNGQKYEEWLKSKGKGEK